MTRSTVSAAAWKSLAHPRMNHAVWAKDSQPLTFATTLVLSDGSTLTLPTTTSPVKPLIKMVKDTRNHALWNPSSKTMDDRTGSMSAFAKRYADLGRLE